MSSLFDATVKAVENANEWGGGAVVLDLGGDFEAYPGAYLHDISFTQEYEEIIVDLSDGLETSTGYSLKDASAEKIAELLLQ